MNMFSDLILRNSKDNLVGDDWDEWEKVSEVMGDGGEWRMCGIFE